MNQQRYYFFRFIQLLNYSIFHFTDIGYNIKKDYFCM